MSLCHVTVAFLLAVIISLLSCATASDVFHEAQLLAAAAGANESCSVPKFKMCTHQLARRLTNRTNLPDNPAELTADVMRVFSTKEKLVEFCWANDVFRSCVEDFTGAGCMTPEVLFGLGVDGWFNVGYYISMFAEWNFFCTDDVLKVALDNFDCMISTFAREEWALLHCVDVFTRNSLADPTNICKHAAKFATCYGEPFHRRCGRHLGGVFCGMLKSAFLFSGNCTNIECN